VTGDGWGEVTGDELLFCRRAIYLLIVLYLEVAGFTGEHFGGLLLINYLPGTDRSSTILVAVLVNRKYRRMVECGQYAVTP